jgi:hypothetical protein
MRGGCVASSEQARPERTVARLAAAQFNLAWPGDHGEAALSSRIYDGVAQGGGDGHEDQASVPGRGVGSTAAAPSFRLLTARACRGVPPWPSSRSDAPLRPHARPPP